MFWLVAVGFWIIGSKLEKIGDELIEMGRVEEDPQVEPVAVPAEDGVWIDPEAIFSLKFRRN